MASTQHVQHVSLCRTLPARPFMASVKLIAWQAQVSGWSWREPDRLPPEPWEENIPAEPSGDDPCVQFRRIEHVIPVSIMQLEQVDVCAVPCGGRPPQDAGPPFADAGQGFEPASQRARRMCRPSAKQGRCGNWQQTPPDRPPTIESELCCGKGGEGLAASLTLLHLSSNGRPAKICSSMASFSVLIRHLRGADACRLCIKGDLTAASCMLVALSPGARRRHHRLQARRARHAAAGRQGNGAIIWQLNEKSAEVGHAV